MEFIPFNTQADVSTRIAADITAAGRKAPILVFLSGGSNVPLLAAMTRSITAAPVTYTLADERFGPPGHADSNWHQLVAAGAVMPEGSYAVLTGRALAEETAAFNTWLGTVAECRFKIGIFGMGLDGHVAGILPGSAALSEPGLAAGYVGPDFQRITITPAMIARLDKAILVIQGAEKLALATRIMSGKRMAPVRALLAVPQSVSYYVL